MGMNGQFVLARYLAKHVFGAPQPFLLQQMLTQSQHSEEAGQGSWAAASEWVPATGGGAVKCPDTWLAEKNETVPTTGLAGCVHP